MKPLVSILIPAYNADQWIAETVQSAIGQTWPRKEIIVVDDGSSDRTAEVARRFISKKVAVVSTENQGAAAARNYGLRLSHGDYIQWLDADDLLRRTRSSGSLRRCGTLTAGGSFFPRRGPTFTIGLATRGSFATPSGKISPRSSGS